MEWYELEHISDLLCVPPKKITVLADKGEIKKRLHNGRFEYGDFNATLTNLKHKYGHTKVSSNSELLKRASDAEELVSILSGVIKDALVAHEVRLLKHG